VASPEFLTHRGRAVVFDGKSELERLYEPDFDIRPGDVVVLRGEGPRGSFGMAGTGIIPVPERLRRLGVTDMVRISDSRMGGTVDGTAVLHVAPEAAVGGPLGLVRTGDTISLDVPRRRVDVEVSEQELSARRESLPLPTSTGAPRRGYARLYVENVMQLDKGCDFDFLQWVDGDSLASQAADDGGDPAH
jgi:dihydroxyacid dehydratase/phosphogluconate dehydratase